MPVTEIFSHKFTQIFIRQQIGRNSYSQGMWFSSVGCPSSYKANRTTLIVDNHSVHSVTAVLVYFLIVCVDCLTAVY